MDALKEYVDFYNRTCDDKDFEQFQVAGVFSP